MVPVEIPEISGQEAPVVLVSEGSGRFNNEKPVTFRRHGDVWLKPMNGDDGLSVDEIVADPTTLHLCDGKPDYGISRSRNGGKANRDYDSVVYAQGPTTLYASRADLPEGAEESLPSYVDPTNGRMESIQESVQALTLVDGQLYRRTVEPVLVMEKSGSFRHDSIHFSIVDRPPEELGVCYRIQDLDLVKAPFMNKENVYLTTPNFQVIRPDLLDFDPLLPGVRKAAQKVLREAIDDLPKATSRYLVAYAELRDALVRKLPYDMKAAALPIDTTVSADRIYDLLVEICDASVESVGIEEVREWEHKNLPAMVELQIRSTHRHSDFLSRFRHTFGPSFEASEIDEPEVESPEDMKALAGLGF
jgi:hypothetical protein